MKFLIVNGPNVNLMRCPIPGVPGGMDYNSLMDWLSSCCAQMETRDRVFPLQP